MDRMRGGDLRVDDLFDALHLLGREGLGMREVKAQLVGTDIRAGLSDVATEHPLERLVEQVGPRMVRPDAGAPALVDLREHHLAL